MSVDPFDFSDAERAQARTFAVTSLLTEGLLAEAFAPSAALDDETFLTSWNAVRSDVLDVVDGRIAKVAQRSCNVDTAIAELGSPATAREVLFATTDGVEVACAVSADQRDVLIVVGPGTSRPQVLSTELASGAELIREIGFQMLLRADLLQLADVD